MEPGQQKFGTSEGMLAMCLYMAGCELANPREICFHIYDPDILKNLGFQGSKLWDAAQEAWKKKARGHVEYSFVLTKRVQELILAYRDQREQLEKSDAKASEMVLDITGRFSTGAMLSDEMLLRVACVNLKIRSEFMNAWKFVVPLLKVPVVGKTERFDTTAISHGKTVPAKGVRKPGYVLVSLNASEETKKKLGLI